jgi:hypothetical protein
LKSLVNLSESSAGLCIVYTGCEEWGGGGGGGKPKIKFGKNFLFKFFKMKKAIATEEIGWVFLFLKAYKKKCGL